MTTSIGTVPVLSGGGGFGASGLQILRRLSLKYRQAFSCKH